MIKVTMNEQGEIALPQQIIDRHKLTAESELELVESGDNTILRPVENTEPPLVAQHPNGPEAAQ